MGAYLWITARMLHVYAVAANMGRPGAYALVEHGINACPQAVTLRDKQHGGWYACVNDEGVIDASKQGYQHFLRPAGRGERRCHRPPRGAQAAGRRHRGDQRALLLNEQEQMCLESWDEAFSKTEDYRLGGNANMHAVESLPHRL